MTAEVCPNCGKVKGDAHGCAFLPHLDIERAVKPLEERIAVLEAAQKLAGEIEFEFFRGKAAIREAMEGMDPDSPVYAMLKAAMEKK